MSAGAKEVDVRSLQRRAEQAIRSAKPRDYIVRLLEQIVMHAGDDTEAASFAHTHLAELLLEESPWRSALHLRRAIQLDAEDDVAHALMGVSQALQQNFRMAVASFRRAVALAPFNPWYNHNVGHLLDVVLDQPNEALSYLKRAYRVAEGQSEVAASLAHCLGRAGRRADAIAIARELIEKDPGSQSHRDLLAWLESGAKTGGELAVPGLLSLISPAAAAHQGSPFVETESPARAPAVPSEVGEGTRGAGAIETLLVHTLQASGWKPDDVGRAWALWREYEKLARPVLGRPEVVAAAIEYAIAKIDGARVKQKDIAERYAVSVSSLQARYAAIRSAVQLQTRDSRFARARKRKEERPS